MNYRNHRKIVVIDGKIGYVGGINIREDHMGKNPKVSPWLDAHIRIQGQAVYVLQNEFLNFWQFCNKKNINTQEYVNNGFFPEVATKGKTTMQIVSSGPDSQKHEIKDSMVKLIQMAEKEIIIQTPYFIPDEVFINALKTAISSGVKVKLMLPGKPDKKMIYFATMSFAREFLEMGGEVYLFKGFVHAKTIVVDNFAMTLGTANIDNRSFNLNFEINAILYDKLIVTKYLSLIKPAFDNSKQVDLSYYTQKSWWTKTKQLFFRLFSPLM